MFLMYAISKWLAFTVYDVCKVLLQIKKKHKQPYKIVKGQETQQ